MDEVVKEFLIESHENLNQLDHDLIELEKDPHSKDLLGSVFRTIHSIKGVSGFLDFPKLEALTHAAEELLSKLRDGELVLNQAITFGAARHRRCCAADAGEGRSGRQRRRSGLRSAGFKAGRIV